MTCLEAQEQFSALADDALSRGDRAALDAHVAGCADCRRELERFQATVSLLHAVEPVRAPVGFVDRVLVVARPAPWYRRWLRQAFLPLPTKVPLEAAALVLVGVGVAYIFQQTPELQQAARMEAPVSSQIETRTVPPETRLSAPAIPDKRSSEPGTSADAPGRTRSDPGMPRTLEKRTSEQQAPVTREAPSPARQAPSAAGETKPQTPEKLLADTARAQSSGAMTEAPVSGSTSSAAAPSASRDALESQRSRDASEPSPTLRRADKTRPAEEKDAARGKNDTSAVGAPPAAATPSVAQSSLQAAPKKEARLEAKGKATSDISGRLTVADRASAERALEDLVKRNGGTLIERRAAPDVTVVEVVVPRATYRQFAGHLDTIGRWVPDGEPSELPAEVRVTLRLQ